MQGLGLVKAHPIEIRSRVIDFVDGVTGIVKQRVTSGFRHVL